MQTLNRNFAKFGIVLFIGLFQLASTASWYTASDGHRYYIEGAANYNWLQALDQCSRQGLQLAVIDSDSKNKALISLLRSIFGSSRDLWLGHHDEFYKKKDKNRSWYSASTGAAITFSYWDSGEPNNKGGEHCTEIYRKADFKWNDENCDTNYFGFICEEHFKTAQCRTQMETKRSTIEQKNNQLSSDFATTQDNVSQIIKGSSTDTDNTLALWENSTQNVMDEFKQSLNELIAKKPYLQAVIGDVGPAIRALAAEAQEEISKLTQQTRQTISEIHVNGEKSVNAENNVFAGKIEDHANEMGRLLVY
ncbi:lectin subunit alpha [Stomoxys calcitrans]|uniref:C-type lectin domain-containing protein n=1 Tax=Stomoxys calcitrans TaxID=35570 RepID=A0A1I8P0Q4_STOCA|nr:lectin subunit alpha [Stomoxys calcitrans]